MNLSLHRHLLSLIVGRRRGRTLLLGRPKFTVLRLPERNLGVASNGIIGPHLGTVLGGWGDKIHTGGACGQRRARLLRRVLRALHEQLLKSLILGKQLLLNLYILGHGTLQEGSLQVLLVSHHFVALIRG